MNIILDVIKCKEAKGNVWILASMEKPGYIPVVVNFVIFFLNDMYGFVSWKKRENINM